MKWVGRWAWTGMRWAWEGPLEERGCYCVCHEPFSSCPACEHCGGKNEVAHFFEVREAMAA